MSQKTAQYPEGFSEGSLGWMHVAKKMTSGMADAWFSSYQSMPVKECLPADQIAYDSIGSVALETSLVVGNEFNLIPEFASTLKEMNFDQVSIVSSPLGQSLMSSLDKLGVKYQREKALLINDEKMIEVPEEIAFKIHSFWSSYFGNSFTQSAEIYQDANGKEYCYWYATVLYGSRGQSKYSLFDLVVDSNDPSSNVQITLSDEEKERGVISFGEWSSKIYLPWLSKCLFYLGETPFPSSLASMSRSLAFSGLAQEKLPIPYMKYAKNDQAIIHSNGRQIEGIAGDVILPLLAPQQVQMGWLFSADDLESHEIILTTLTTALIKVMSYLEDGFLNHNEPNTPFQFDAVVFSDSQLERRFADEGIKGGYSAWIPITEVFDAIETTRVRYESIKSPLKSAEAKRKDLIWLIDEGVGKSYVGSAINDSIWYHMLPQEQWSGIEWYVTRAIEMDILNETSTAISNWGIAKFLQGDFAFAKLLFEMAINRDDMNAEDEASFYLATIFEREGDFVKCEEYRKRCEAAGGYEPTFL